MNRREAIIALASAAAVPLYGCTRRPSPEASTDPEAEVLAIVDRIAENLLRLSPESATSLGIDTGDRAALRSQLTDRSAAGQQRIASQVREDLERVKAIDTTSLTHATRTTVEVVRSATRRRCEGLRFRMATSPLAVGATRRTW